VFTFLEDEGVDDVIKSGDHVTPEDAAGDAKCQDDADDTCDIPSTEPLQETPDNSANDLVTSSPAKFSEDVADLEFRGNVHILTL